MLRVNLKLPGTIPAGTTAVTVVSLTFVVLTRVVLAGSPKAIEDALQGLDPSTMAIIATALTALFTAPLLALTGGYLLSSIGMLTSLGGTILSLAAPIAGARGMFSGMAVGMEMLGLRGSMLVASLGGIAPMIAGLLRFTAVGGAILLVYEAFKHWNEIKASPGFNDLINSQLSVFHLNL